MAYHMSTESEPDSYKALLASALLSLAMLMLISQFVHLRVSLRNISKVELKSPTSQVYAEAIPDVLVPIKPPQPAQKPVEAPKAPEVVVTPPPAVQAPTPAPEAPKPVVKKVAPVSSNEAKAFIYHHESTNRLNAMNKNGACGLGQSLPCSKLSSVCPNWENDYECQDRYFEGYMKSRYGSWSNARAFWLEKKAKTGSGWW